MMHNDTRGVIEVAGLQTSARRAYLDLHAKKPAQVLVQDATHLRLDGAPAGK
ncbi:MAG: hypothetical protein WCO56_16140 [Verrucomicrobiota bacterium]